MVAVPLFPGTNTILQVRVSRKPNLRPTVAISFHGDWLRPAGQNVAVNTLTRWGKAVYSLLRNL